MRKLLVLGLFMMSMAPAANADVSWTGGAGVRHVISKANDGLETKNGAGKDTSIATTRAWQFRASVGASLKGESVDWGMDIRTTGGTTSEWNNTTNNADYAQNIGQVYGRYHDKVMDTDWSVTVGRQKTVLLYDNLSQLLFDNDTRWDGLGWTWTNGMFGLNLSQFVLGSTNRGVAAQASTYTKTEASESVADTQSRFAVLYAFQPWVQLKVSDEITGKFAVGFLHWSGTGSSSGAGFYTNPLHGGTVGTVPAAVLGGLNPIVMDNARQWQVVTDWSLPFSLRFVGEYIRNKKVHYGTRLTPTNVEADNDALGLSLSWNKPKKAGDFGLIYSFSDKGIASVINTFTNGDAPADNRSHLFEGKYMLADGVSFGAKAQYHKEKARLDGNGAGLVVPDDKRNQTRSRYELIGGVQF